MPTTKFRINVSLADDILAMLAKVSTRDRVPQATKAARLIELALELEEDQVWDARAQKRDMKGARYVSHRKAWAQNPS
ncbi:MAG: hypothetical protein HY978_00445 [Candidatus Liptonbacteria bacterium]|nr:hypothetical protein [Candidatus Liptonbacteria bacterium]